MAPTRAIAGLVSVGYFLAASRGLPQGVANYYAADLWPGLLLWGVASLAFVAVHAALWTERPGTAKAARYLAAAVLMGVPPFGIIGWAHPLTAAGVLFPGWGWWGVGATGISLLAMTSRRWPAIAIVLTGWWLWSAATWTEPERPVGWVGVDLEMGSRLGRDASLEHHRDLVTEARRAVFAYPDAWVVVLPEMALGFWTPTVERLWRSELRDADFTVVAGAAVIAAQGYDNVLIEISARQARILYRERMPVPVSMWQPWLRWTGQGGGAHAHFFANPVVDVGGTELTPLICYEQLLLWPALQSMLHSPDMVVAVGNGWWTTDTSIVAIQKASATAWTRLFDRPLVTAFNF